MNPILDDDDFESMLNDPVDQTPTPGDLAPEPSAPLPHQDLAFFGKIPVNVTLEVASTEITLQALMEISASSVIVLDKLAGAPLDVKVNGALFAKAEVVVLNGNYGLRVIELCGSAASDMLG